MERRVPPNTTLELILIAGEVPDVIPAASTCGEVGRVFLALREESVLDQLIGRVSMPS